ncbi:MFS transporter [Anaeroarcus burkinensis]|uniref:MFS transporter n=1 Tax=Anaeroarcus burkinensis TaxID=82376 RepID=UPI000483D3D0|nr:MFS transporter [Anaeroarcus burkinensis]
MNRRSIAWLTSGHFFTDLNQGALPALLPFLMTEHQLSYAAAAGLMFANSLTSSIIQPLFGFYADRLDRPRLMPWAVLLAGLGLALLGWLESYLAMFLAVAISGIGVAAFHPESARLANLAAGDKKATGIGLFGIGGNAGFAVGPLLGTFLVLAGGLKNTAFFLLPAICICFFLQQRMRHFGSLTAKVTAASVQAEPDNWPAFGRLSIVVICRSILFAGLNTFIPLYWIHVLLQSHTTGSSALTVLFSVGVIGTFFGGRWADRYGYLRVIRIGYLLLIPILLLFVSTEEPTLAMILLIPIGMSLFAPYSPTVVLGQKYLPQRMGFASGITLGLAVSVGGIAAPGLGWLADQYGLAFSFTILTILPVIAALASYSLPKPAS